jgi:hypothetical protein
VAPYLVAAGIAVLVAGVELRSRLPSRPTLRGGAWIWWIGRLGVDALIGIAAVTVIGVHGRPAWVTGVIAGVGGASFVRWSVTIPGEGGEPKDIGILKAYEPIRTFFESSIADIGAVEQQKWISEKILPRLTGAGFDVADLADRLTWYVEATAGIRSPSFDRQATLKFIDSTLHDSVSDETKARVLILHAVNELRAYRIIRSLYRSAKRRQKQSGRGRYTWKIGSRSS